MRISVTEMAADLSPRTHDQVEKSFLMPGFSVPGIRIPSQMTKLSPGKPSPVRSPAGPFLSEVNIKGEASAGPRVQCESVRVSECQRGMRRESGGRGQLSIPGSIIPKDDPLVLFLFLFFFCFYF